MVEKICGLRAVIERKMPPLADLSLPDRIYHGGDQNAGQELFNIRAAIEALDPKYINSETTALAITLSIMDWSSEDPEKARLLLDAYSREGGGDINSGY